MLEAVVVLVSLLVAALLVPSPASAQNDDPDIRVSIENGELREGSRATLTFELLDSPALENDKAVYLALGGTAEAGSQADFTLTFPNGTPLPSIGDVLYNRKIVIPAGRTSVTARINVRNDRDAEQCEMIEIEALTRETSPKRFLGILNLTIPANDLDRRRTERLPSVSVPSLYPQVGVKLTATFDDPDDGRIFSQQWTWARSSGTSGPWTTVAQRASYTPEPADIGRYLRVEVRYENVDGEPACAHVISEAKVQSNSGDGMNSAPDFGSEPFERQVLENSPIDTRVGAPVTASDPDNDPLTYGLEGADADLFRIDPETGQITTTGEPLDTNGHTVTVTATDPSLASTSVPVTIDVTDNPERVTTNDNNGGTNNPTNNGSNSNNGSNNGGNSNNNGGNSGNSNNNNPRNNGGEDNDDETGQPTTGGYSDLDSAGMHTEAVKQLAEEGVVDDTGCNPMESLLCPGGPVLRWEAAVWFVRVLDGNNPDPIASTRFTDVSPGVWWAPYVERLAELEVTVGCIADPSQYCPEVVITRAQMATMLYKAFDLTASEPAGFVDTSGSIHAPRIDASYTSGITNNCSANPLRFCPLDSNTRGEFATYLVRGRAHVDTRGT